MILRVLAVASGLIALSATATPAAAQASTRHPNAAYVTPAPRTATVAFGAAAARPDGQQTLVGTIGREDGPPATLLGRVTQASFLDDTTVAILDRTTQDVRLFSATGRHLETIGRKGEGPGEFRAPQAVVRAPSGELLISDIRRTIQFFRRGARGFEHRTTWQLPFSPRSMCFLGERLFVNATSLEDPSILHELAPDGTVRRSFGSVYRSPNALLNYEVGQGRIACDARRQLIYFMGGGVLGEVRAFRPTGELMWRVQVTDFLSNIVTDLPDGMAVAGNPLGAHAGVGLALVDGDALLAMWTFSSPEEMRSKTAPSATQVVRIDPATGKATSLGREADVVLDRRGPLWLAMSEEPFPRVDVRRGTLRAATR